MISPGREIYSIAVCPCMSFIPHRSNMFYEVFVFGSFRFKKLIVVVRFKGRFSVGIHQVLDFFNKS